LFSIQIEGGQKHRTGLQIDITGNDGVLRITNPRAFENKDDNAIEEEWGYVLDNVAQKTKLPRRNTQLRERFSCQDR
jgi:hypothetical protein